MANQRHPFDPSDPIFDAPGFEFDEEALYVQDGPNYQPGEQDVSMGPTRDQAGVSNPTSDDGPNYQPGEQDVSMGPTGDQAGVSNPTSDDGPTPGENPAQANDPPSLIEQLINFGRKIESILIILVPSHPETGRKSDECF